jgi:NAD(P)-dependent dehydrogenase (short-subunit alcohol dehydrogenase family)
MNVLIVGGSQGIGRAIAGWMAGRGHVVGLVARTAEPIDEAVKALGTRAMGYVADVLDHQAIQSAVGRFVDAAGGLDTLVYAAGRFRAIGPLVEVDTDDWWVDVATTLKGFANVVSATVPYLRLSTAPSLIALIGPGHARELAFGTGYGIAQAGLARLVESLNVELRRDTIPVYAVNPGLVPTPMMNHLLDSAGGRRWLPRFTEAFAEGKEVGPEVAAEMVAWLAETRPIGLGGRVVASMSTPALIEGRVERIVEDDLGTLRIR